MTTFPAASASDVVVARVPPGTHVQEVPLPFTYPGVTGAYIHMDASGVTEYNGDDKDLISVDIIGQGPARIALSRWNQGDFAPRFGALHPFRQTNLAVVGGSTGWASDDPADVTTQASVERIRS